MYEELYSVARALANRYSPSEEIESGTVAAALHSEDGATYTGVCIDSPCGLGFCAEHSAVAEMLKEHKSLILYAIAVDHEGNVLPPCGRCRQLMLLLNPANEQAVVYLASGEQATLGELLPHAYS